MIYLTTGGSGSGDGDIISSSQELRHGKGIIGEEYTLPGQASGERIGPGKLVSFNRIVYDPIYYKFTVLIF